MEVIRIENSYLNSNTYLLIDPSEDYCWVVDIGDVDLLLKHLPANKSVKGVFLTHTHYDHIYGINNLLRIFPGLVVYTSRYGSEALYSEKANLSKYQDNPLVYTGKNVVVLSNEDEVQLFPSEVLKAVETLGHCPSCLTFNTHEYLFTGDSYIPGVKVVTKLPGGDKQQAVKSIEKILRLGECKIICPGHGEMKYGSNG